MRTNNGAPASLCRNHEQSSDNNVLNGSHFNQPFIEGASFQQIACGVQYPMYIQQRAIINLPPSNDGDDDYVRESVPHLIRRI